ncbi:histidine kinase [Saccharothrix australiensis]|uniref:Histidine kinase/DNA gyrase B/HSP90-like ATPase n=1 Tax=Saccharothrix australiensis TaxID=2072 RepID=A0A495W4G3_9PSEU|nr:histidine kinase [Saccharothrix australiensis]RKT56566.1 histidine kinase/DNA gyrase B/HSP90-like ATPase [Saccharothrix australiensis]
MRRRSAVSTDPADEAHRRVLRDLHDGLGPSLAAIALGLRAARHLVARDPAAAGSLLARLEDEAHDAAREVRRLAAGARPAAPITDASPAAPITDARPAAPAADARPAEPTADTRPAEPVADARPAAPVADTCQAEPAADTRQAEPTTDTRPGRPVADARPAAPATGDCPAELAALGLVGAVRAHVAVLADRHPVRVLVRVDPALPELPVAVRVAAYRIIREALTNVVRHARARTCEVRLWCADGLHVEVVDDGCGADRAASAGVGLGSMRERAHEVGGTWAMEGAAAGGTRIAVALPVAGAV